MDIKEKLSKHVYNVIDNTNRTLSDSPMSAMLCLARLQGYVTGVAEAANINDFEWLMSIDKTIESHVSSYQRELALKLK